MKKLAEKSGDLLITHTGLSGPVILDISRFIRKGDTIRASFVKGMSETEMDALLLSRFRESGTRQVRKVLSVFGLPERLVDKILELAKIAHDQTGAQLSKESRLLLVEYLTGFPFVASRLGGVEEAMVTRGGVALEEVSSRTMESRLVSDSILSERCST